MPIHPAIARRIAPGQSTELVRVGYVVQRLPRLPCASIARQQEGRFDMRKARLTRHPRTFVVATGILALAGGAALAPSQVNAAAGPDPAFAKHVVLQSGLDNPRQLQRFASGDFL